MKKFGSFLTKTIWLTSAITLSAQADTSVERCHKELGFTASIVELFDNARYRLTMQECLSSIRDNGRKAIYSLIDEKYMGDDINDDMAFRVEINKQLNTTLLSSGSDFSQTLSILGPTDENPQKFQLDTVQGYQSSDR